jgi:FKBP-type peptidyl-prolyl cis-trans isomerase FklB
MTRKRAVIAATGLLALAGVVATAARGRAPQVRPPESPKEKLSYAMGVALAKSFEAQGADIDPGVLLRGLEDALAGNKLFMDGVDLRTTVGAFDADVQRKQVQIAKRIAEDAKRQGEAFLADNAKKEGVVSLPSGLQYRILKQGDGVRPTYADAVECRYRGTRLDGVEFDSSSPHGRPATFDVAAVLPGWREALKLMPVGSKWQLFVPPELAYGERALRGEKGPGIGPNATLIFELELLAIRAPSGAGERTAAASRPQRAKKD